MEKQNSFYLKFRPRQLIDLVGQRNVVKTLTQASITDRFSHAYLLAGQYGGGKCIKGDSLVLLKNNTSRIDRIVPNSDIPGAHISRIDLQVVDESGIGSTHNGYFEKDVETIKIKTRDGYSLEGTPEHKIRIINADSRVVWKKLSDIKNGDFCAIFRSEVLGESREKDISWSFDIDKYISKYFNGEEYNKNRIACQIVQSKIPNTFNKDMARLFGYFVAEGYFSKTGKSISIANADLEIIEDIKNIVKSQFNYDVQIVDDKRNAVKNVVISSVFICQFLDDLGLNHDSFTKDIPDIVLESPKHIIKEFLRSYFEGDGYVEKGKRDIGCLSVSEKLINQIQTLLLSFGIISSLKPKKTTLGGEEYISYRLTIRSNNVKLFIGNIGFICKRKIGESLDIQTGITGNTNNDIIPYLFSEFLTVKSILPITKSGRVFTKDGYIRSPKSYGITDNIGENLTYKNLNLAADYFKFFIPYVDAKDIDKIILLINKIENLIKLNYFYSPIVGISKGKCDVYDISKDGDDKSFIANGFINHNTTTARILAALMTCEDVKDGITCGKCRACQTVYDGMSTDIIEIDGASKRGVDDAKIIIENSKYSPQELKRKVYIIDEVHMLSKEAISSLLKTLEEPPPNVCFILCTTDIKKMLPTILSRCQRFNFGKIPAKEVAKRLLDISKKEDITLDNEAALILAKLGKGGMRDCLGFLEQISLSSKKERITSAVVYDYFGLANKIGILEMVKAILSSNIPLLLDQVNDMIMSSVNTKDLMFEISEVFRNLMVIKASKDANKILDLSEAEIEEFKKMSENIKLSQLLKLSHLFSDIEKKMEFNINERWIIEATLINCVASLRV